ncbi:MAG: penicillin-binding protein [Myxococcales bacterium]|nr:penicillin-binding protein [Myxococcales bacterium]
MLPTNLPPVRDMILQAEHWFPSARSVIARLRPTWRTTLPVVLSLGVLAAIPHTLHAEASAAEPQPTEAQAAPPQVPPPPAVILASTTGDPELPASAPKAPRVDLSHLRYDDGKAYAKADDGSEAELTIDPHVQQGVERLLRRAHPVRGAIVVTDTRTGKVVAVADATHDKPAGGRVAFGYAAPTASLFKMVTAAALLEHAHVSPKLRVCTDGGHRRIERKHLEPAKGPHALCAPFWSALGHSRNAVFAQLATRFLMRDQLAETAQRFGFNQDLPFSQKAVVGHTEIPYNDLEFARTAAGFGDTQFTALGAAHAASIIAHAGRDSELTLVQKWKGYQAPDDVQLGERRFKRSTARLMRKMMELTVSGGTSLEAFSRKDGMSYLPNIRVAGKTGTLKPTRKSPTTSWFVGFAPSRSPHVVVSVLLMNDDVWYYKANEVARDVLRLYYEKQPGVTNPFDADHD